MDLTGAELDRLSLKEQIALGGKWVALEVYDRNRLPVRRIAAAGDSVAECVRALTARGLDPSLFEFRTLKPPRL